MVKLPPGAMLGDRHWPSRDVTFWTIWLRFVQRTIVPDWTSSFGGSNEPSSMATSRNLDGADVANVAGSMGLVSAVAVDGGPVTPGDAGIEYTGAYANRENLGP